MSPTFDSDFQALTGHPPFPWQRDLFANHFMKGSFPDACTLPTGLGKTSVVAVWLLALAANPSKVPRRLVYVVNRRTVVDQTTAEVEKYRMNLEHLPDLAARLSALCAEPVKVPLALSTLRGQFADNREWSGDPARPAVVVGTVDMIGSRLLFSGYGCGFRTRPPHAGFLGQDALLIHDEAHLEPAFQARIEAIRAEQRRCGEFRPFHVTALTATPRVGVRHRTRAAGGRRHPPRGAAAHRPARSRPGREALPRPARVWTTVTPVRRPGFDDRDRDKAEKLLRKAFADAGLPPPAGVQWRGVGNRAGVDLAQQFEPPENLKDYPRFHVRVTWATPVPGPAAVGAGRYRGFGLFVADPGG
jgi:hypothetical protein